MSNQQDKEDDAWERYADERDHETTVDGLAEYGTKWYRKITSEESMRKMMFNYLNSITDDHYPESKIEEAVDEALERVNDGK